VAQAKDRFDDPSSGQQHETALGLRQFDDLERNAVFNGGGRWLLPGVALRRDKRPFAIGNVRAIRLAGHRHPATLRIYSESVPNSL
jgi:hypothetical protein